MSFARALLEALLRDSRLITPQLLLVGAATLMLWPLDGILFQRGEKRKWAPVTLVVLALTGLLMLGVPSGSGFSGMYKVDGLARGFQWISLLSAIATVFLSQRMLDGMEEQTVEYYAMILFALSGMFFLAGATDLVSIYFSLELMAVCIYILAAYLRNQDRSIEAGVKYFLLGAFSSGILLYGLSLLFIAAGGQGTNLSALNQALAMAPKNSDFLVFAGVLMVLVGFGFKVAAVPFHQWSPDAYDGAPTPITAFMATAPKAAAIAAFIRLFGTGLHGVSSDWVPPLSFVAGASMVWGNVAALRQSTMKRMLAYSSIAHVGYMLMGVLSMDVAQGAQVIWLYMGIYLFMNMGAFAVVIHLQGKGEGERIEDFRGLGRRQPVLAFAMMVFLLSLAGIPPLLGFFGKFFLFKLAIEQGYVFLTTLALVTSAISAYYYLMVVNQMYFREAPEGDRPALGTAIAAVVTAACAVTLIGTAFGPWLLEWAGRIGV
ncbi:MAG: NADH-quinone oxidoreductase subunit N [Acidobacteria bacterium]|nr:NADH-quinone oxidoreductase subunit N [Acidobacteriota bacterium]